MKGTAQALEFDKILSAAANYAVLEGGRLSVLSLRPTRDLSEARSRMDGTEEAHRLLFTLGAGKIEYFPPYGDSLERAAKGAALSPKELLDCARLLRSSRVFAEGIAALSAGSCPRFEGLAERVVFDRTLEREIFDKLPDENTVADNASEKLFELRTEIRRMGEKIRARLARYLTGEERKYLQDDIVTVRGDRFVIPVKAEYKRNVRGFVHDRSSTGATVFVEPEEALEMNNELRSLEMDERAEVERILLELSERVGRRREELENTASLLAEADGYFARAEYAYSMRAVKPALNGKGVVDIRKGRHPLLDAKTAVPVTVSVGEDCRFLVISGANTGGKTVTLKMCGLFCLMGACGFFLPAAEGTRVSVAGVYCDVGDSQSIEENLSTFSSHVMNLKEILSEAGEYSFVLADEPGGGTDPEEGQALARAVLTAFLKKGCRGIVTTHYSALKEFAYETEGLENGSMEFDPRDLRPLYRLKTGAPGASNALAICTRLGLPEEIVSEARGYLSEGARAFERTLSAAEESRVKAEALSREAAALKGEWEDRLSALEKEEAKFQKERERFLLSSKAEARRIVNERTAEAEELIEEIRSILQKETITEGDLVRARTAKNKMSVKEEEAPITRALPLPPEKIDVGTNVFVGSLGAEGKVLSVSRNKGVAVVQTGSLRVTAKIGDLFAGKGTKREETVKIDRSAAPLRPEIDLIGMTVLEMEPELEKFLDDAVLAGYDEVRVVHGMGTGKLRSAVRELLRRRPDVKGFRPGKYGEGEGGVTIVTLG